MNVVEKVVEHVGGQTALASRLTEITGHQYRQGHISYYLRVGHFPADIAGVVANEIMCGAITEDEACPKIKRSAA